MLGTATLADRRRETLAPLIEELNEFVRVRSGCAPTSVVVAGHRLSLDPWERLMLHRAIDPDEVDRAPWLNRISQVLVLRSSWIEAAKSLEDAEGLNSRRTSDLIHLAGIGLALLHELQRDVHQRVRGGDLENAKRLTAFRNRLQTEVDELCKGLGEERSSMAREQSGEMIEPETQGDRQPVSAPPVADPREAPRRATRAGAGAALSAPQNYTRSLMIVLAFALVSLAALHLMRGPHSVPPVLEPAQFARIESVISVEARPPSLFVLVDAESWRAMDTVSRTRAVDAVGSIASTAGYQGASLRTAQGRVVGDWLRRRGSRLRDIDRPSS